MYKIFVFGFSLHSMMAITVGYNLTLEIGSYGKMLFELIDFSLDSPLVCVFDASLELKY